MIQKLLVVIDLLLFAGAVRAVPVGPDDARHRAEEFVARRLSASRGVAPSSPAVGLAAAVEGAYFVFNVGRQQGFVIVSGDDRAPSVLAYSDGGSFDAAAVPANVQAWLDALAGQVRLLGDATTGAATGPQDAAGLTPVRRNISPLIQTHWDQDRPYWNDCPRLTTASGAAVSTVTGCVATAMAQLMYYHRWPQQVKTAIPAYTCLTDWAGYGHISRPAVDAGTPIDWDLMWTAYPYRANSTAEASLPDDEQKADAAVARLMSYCGTAVNMEYRPSSSGGSSASVVKAGEALVSYFDYDAGLRHVTRTDYSAEQWDDLIYSELQAGRPVLYEGSTVSSGHAFIVDGFEAGYYHVNWGWSGSYDCYTLLSVVNPYNNSGTGASSTRDGYSIGQGALVGVQRNIGTAVPVAPAVMGTYDLTATETTLTRNAQGNFSVSLEMNTYNWSGATNTFDVGFGLYDADGHLLYVKTLTSKWTLGPTSGGGRKGTMEFGAGLADGFYRICGVSRVTGTDSWHENSVSNYPYPTFYYAVISGDQLQLMLPSVDLTATAVSVEGNLQGGTTQHVVADIRNDGTDFNGYLYLLVNGTAKAGKVFQAAAGKVARLDIEWLADKAGTYTLSIATAAEGGTVVGTATVTIAGTAVPAGTSNVDLALSARLVNATTEGGHRYIMGNKMKVVLTARNDTDTDYSGRCGVYCWTWTGNGATPKGHLTDLYVAAHSSADVAFEYDVAYGGTYSATSLYDKSGNYVEDRSDINVTYTPRPAVAYIGADGTEQYLPATASIAVPAGARRVDLSGQSVVTAVDATEAMPNCLFLMDGDAATPDGLAANVVKGTTAARVELTDGYDLDLPFDVSAGAVSYERTFSQGTDGRGKGWQTLVLPFDVAEVKAGDRTIDWFHSADDKGKNFWVMELVSDGEGTVVFRHADAIRAYTPYIIAVPDGRWGPAWDLRQQPITFVSAGEALLRKDASPALTGRHYQFRGTMSRASLDGVYVLNDEGTAFSRGDALVEPFRAYFRDFGYSYATALDILTPGGLPTAIAQPRERQAQDGAVYTLDGRRADATARQLQKGVYVAGGKKIMK